MDLFVFRHAWAEERDAGRWPDDGLRPLTAAGRERFARMVDRLGDRGVVPSIVATSPLVRCRQTADLLADGMSHTLKVVELDALAPGSNRQALLKWTVAASTDHDQIAWVGHSPDVDLLVAVLIGDGNGWIRFAKGAVAGLRFEDAVCPGGGELRWMVTAKLLGC